MKLKSLTPDGVELTEDKFKYLPKLPQKFEELFYGTLGMWKTDPVYFELKKIPNQCVFYHIQH